MSRSWVLRLPMPRRRLLLHRGRIATYRDWMYWRSLARRAARRLVPVYRARNRQKRGLV